MDITTINKLLDNEETRKLLLKVTEEQLEYIKNYKSLDQCCLSGCKCDCDDCDDEPYNNRFFVTNDVPVAEALQTLCDEHHLKIVSYVEYKEDDDDGAVSYFIQLKDKWLFTS